MIAVGLLDSGVDAALAGHVLAAASFTAGEPGAVPSGHGTALARVILHHAPEARLLVAQAFGPDLRAAPADVAAALGWLASRGARVVNLSIGLREDREVLRAAVAGALAAELILVAATPARGGPVYPAAYPGVLRVTGDARCGPGDLSRLGGMPADYGACPKDLDGSPRGASCATAHVTGMLASAIGRGETEPRAILDALARHHGRERRLA
jgi:hypothetical protein